MLSDWSSVLTLQTGSVPLRAAGDMSPLEGDVFAGYLFLNVLTHLGCLLPLGFLPLLPLSEALT